MSASLKTILFDELPSADLVVDAVYEGSYDGQLGGEPLSKLVPGVGNRGGFRMNGRGDDSATRCCLQRVRTKIGRIRLT